MSGIGRLSGRIRSCLERHKDELAASQKLVDRSMNDLLKQRERFATIARRIMKSDVRPRVEEIVRHFPNASIDEHHGDADFHCVCRFAHTPRFPATVTLDICLLPGESNTEITVRYDLEILPLLMKYKRNEEMCFPLTRSDNKIGRWLEDTIVECLDTYLLLESHPLYQKENIVTDPVCGMQISSIAAPSKIEWPDRTIYFCSEVCKEAFLKGDK